MNVFHQIHLLMSWPTHSLIARKEVDNFAGCLVAISLKVEAVWQESHFPVKNFFPNNWNQLHS